MPTGDRAEASSAKQTRKQAALEEQASASQADTEPLSFEEEEEEEEEDDDDDEYQGGTDRRNPGTMDGQAAQDALDAVAAASPLAAGRDDTSAADAQMSSLEQSGDVDADAEGEDDDEDAEIEQSGDEDAPGEDEAETEPVGPDASDNRLGQGLQAGVELSGDVFSDESELSDESDEVGAGDDDNEDEDDDEDDDDEMGGDDDEDADGEDEEEDEDAEAEEYDDDAAEEEDENEAVKGLAALTGGIGKLSQEEDNEEGAEPSGLDSLADLATAGADGSEQSHDDSDTDSIASSRRSGKFKRTVSQPKASSRLKEVTAASSIEAKSDESEGDENESDSGDQGKAYGDGGDRALSDEDEGQEMSSLGGLSAAAKKKAARSGPAAGLLAGAPAITVEGSGSGAQSAATSREGSPKEDDEGEHAEREHIGDEGQDEAHAELKDGNGGIDTPAQEAEEAVLEEDPSTDEAAVKRQDAMDVLTKIEIGFAILRDKLYVERMEEINKEGEMILEGVHPDLLYLTNLIEARRERRLRLAERYFEQQEAQYERVAHAEDAAAWSNWRNEVSTLRMKQMDDVSRKRRKLDREKRSADGPRPPRRHQVFETELVRNPHFDEAQAKHKPRRKAKRRVRQEIEDLDEMGAYVAYPDLRPAEDGEAWVDLERMGIQPDPRLMQTVPFYRMEEVGMDPNGVYMPDGYPHQAEMMGYGGPPMMQQMREGAMMDRQYDAGPPPPGHFIDNFGNPVPTHMYGGPGPRGPIDDGMMHPQPVPMPQNQAQGPRKPGKKSSPGISRTPKGQAAGVGDDRHRKGEASNAAAKRANAAAQGRTPPMHTRPGPGMNSHQGQPLPHGNMPPSMPHPSDIPGMNHRPPPPGPYMNSYGGGIHGGHLGPDGDGFYGGQGPPPPGAMMAAPGAGHFQQGPPPQAAKGQGPSGPSHNRPPMQPQQQQQRSNRMGSNAPGPPPPHSPVGMAGSGPPPFDARRPPGEPMYTR